MPAITNEEIYNEFQRMKDTLDRWRVKVEAKQEKHDNFLYGNGDVGIDERVRNAERDLAEIKQLAKAIQPMVIFYKVGVWVLTLVGASVIALIWSLITGQIELLFK